MDWADVFGYAGVVANVAWLMMSRRSRFLAGQAIACGLMAAHFWLLESVTGAAVMLVAGLTASLAIPLGAHPRFKLVYVASASLAPLLVYLSWQGGSSAFSAAVLVVVCVANYQIDEVRQRGLLLLALLAWAVHNALIGSIPALISNGIALVVSVTMLLRAVRSRHDGAGAWVQAKPDPKV